MIQFSSVTQLFMTLCDPKDCSTYIINSRSLLKLMSIELVMLFNHLILCHPLLLLPSILSSIRSFQMNQFLASGGQIIGVSASASVLPMNIQDWFPLDGLVWSPCSPRDSQGSSPAPQFENVNSSVFSLVYGPALTSVFEYWKNEEVWLHRPLLAK